MAIMVNENKVEKNTVNLAIALAEKTDGNVVIFSAKIGKVEKQMILTEKEWNGCENKDELTKITVIDKNGNYVD